MRRVIGLFLVFLLTLTLFSLTEGTVKVRALEKTQVTVADVTIDGSVGIPIDEQTFHITVENGKFDTDQFYVGKDISDYFYEYNYQINSSKKNFIDSAFIERYCYIPLGLKVIITETSETELKCSVSGTPFSPSVLQEIKVYFRKSMFKEINGYSQNEVYVQQVSGNAVWNAKNPDEQYSKGSYNLSSATNGKSIAGKAGETDFNVDFTLTLNAAVFIRNMPAGTDVSCWFDGSSGNTIYNNRLPGGLSVILTSDVKIGDKECNLKLKGTPIFGSQAIFVPQIPLGYIAGGTTKTKYWSDVENISQASGQSNYKFNIQQLENEPPYIDFNRQKAVVYAGTSYSDSAPIKLPFKIVNGLFKDNPTYTDAMPGYSENNTHLYSNSEGNMNMDAPGFLYSSVKTGHLNVYRINATNWSANTYAFSLYVTGTPTKIGEYDLTYFVPLSMIADQPEEGNTVVAKTGGKLVVIHPVQLTADNAEIDLCVGKMADTYITIKARAGINRNNFKSSLTTETLKYEISDKLKSHGLNLTPVTVAKDAVVFKLSGMVEGKAEKIDIADCVTFDFSDFESLTDAYGPATVVSNSNAMINIDGSEYGKAGQEIDYSPREDVKIYPTNKSGAKVETTYINMTQEKLITDMSIKCFSTDGGTKWKEAKSALNEKGFQKLLQKGMTLAIADKWDSKEKAPTSDAVILTFSKTEKQASKPKFKIDYVTYADATGETTGQFILTDVEGTAYTASTLRSTYEIGIASGKSLNEDGYGVWPVNGGLTIAKLENNKVQKTVYYIRTAATTTTPASKEVKISVSGQQKMPNLKIDYKKEVIKGKEGLAIRCGETYLAKNISKEDAKDSLKEINIAAYLTVGERVEFDIWQSATVKKPASAIRTITAAARAAAATASADVVAISKGKLSLKKGYEAYDSDKQKWGGLPKIEASCTILIRKKADAKAGKENDTTYASGESMKLVVTYGVIDESKNKSGVTAAILESEKNASQSSGSGDNSSGSGEENE